MRAAACTIMTWRAKRHVGGTVILKASETYVIASYVASVAGRMRLIAGNRLSVCNLARVPIAASSPAVGVLTR